MINIPVNITIPQLWGSKTFSKNEWGEINLIVGPNGTGKSLFAEQLKQSLKKNDYQPRLLSAERLSGLEKQDYSYFQSSSLSQGFNISYFTALKNGGENFGLSSSAFIVLKERLNVRIKIEALLSDIFKKNIRLVEEGGYLKPKIQNIRGGVEYGLKESECHGLKELLTLLTFLYDDGKNCLIFDEPELHLHPQFQSFLLGEIRKIAGNPKIDTAKKMFFIITHSPYFLDFRTIDDLKNIIVCHYEELPNFIDTLEEQDEYILKKFLPRFNTHHKQFFFSPNPVFVEGYTDQQIITLLFDKIDYNINASGSSIIDVGGKDELAVFFKLCKKLNIKARIIADLDAFFKGKLREIVQVDERCNRYIQENGLGTDLSNLIGELDRKLKSAAEDLITKSVTDYDIKHIVDFLNPIITAPEKKHTVIISFLIALLKHKEKILTVVSPVQKKELVFVISRFSQLLEAYKAANVFIFPKGEIENYYINSRVDYLNINEKDKSDYFHAERDYILHCNDAQELESNYAELINTLKSAVPQIKVDLRGHLKFQIVEWLQTVQREVAKGDVSSVDGLKTNAKIDYNLFGQIIDVVELCVEADRKFVCKIKIKSSFLGEDLPPVEFTEVTIPHSFDLESRALSIDSRQNTVPSPASPSS
jgi:hypothetical protein